MVVELWAGANEESDSDKAHSGHEWLWVESTGQHEGEWSVSAEGVC